MEEKEKDEGPARGQLMLKDQDSVTGTVLVQRLLNVASRWGALRAWKLHSKANWHQTQNSIS